MYRMSTRVGLWKFPDRENHGKLVFSRELESREIQSGIPEFQVIFIGLKISKQIEFYNV